MPGRWDEIAEVGISIPAWSLFKGSEISPGSSVGTIMSLRTGGDRRSATIANTVDPNKHTPELTRYMSLGPK
eukprot:scaffold2357_cov167-Amphora_coffeaeformis.AAC.25